MQSILVGAHLWFLAMLWWRVCLFRSGGNYLCSCSFASILCRSYWCAISKPDEIGCQVTPASGSMSCDAFLLCLACCISIGTNRAYGTLLVQYITFLLYFSNVQYITDIFLCHLEFLFFLTCFCWTCISWQLIFYNCTFLCVFRLNDILVNDICYGIWLKLHFVDMDSGKKTSCWTRFHLNCILEWHFVGFDLDQKKTPSC